MVLVLVFLISGCSLSDGIITRIGGDPAGFATEEFSFRKFAADSDSLTMQIVRDTVLDGINYIQVDIDDKPEFFMYTEEWIYSRIEFNGEAFNVPFINKILLEGKAYALSDTCPAYSYSFTMKNDSIVDLNTGMGTFSNVYAVSTILSVHSGDADSVMQYKYFLSSREGILGYGTDDEIFILAYEE